MVRIALLLYEYTVPLHEPLVHPLSQAEKPLSDFPPIVRCHAGLQLAGNLWSAARLGFYDKRQKFS